MKYVAGELSKQQLEKEKPLLAPYWWVKQVEKTDDTADTTANMKFENSGKPVFTKVLVNSKAIKKNDVLVVSIHKKKKA